MNRLLFATFVLLCSTTYAHADNQNPDRVRDFWTQTVSGNEIRLSWNAPADNVGVVGYNLYRNNRYFTTVYGTSYIDYELSPNNTYRYYIVAFDQNRNYSEKSAVVTGSTTSDGNASDSGSLSAPGGNNSGGKPGIPGNVQARALSDTSVELTWEKPDGAVEGYDLYRDNRYFTTVRGDTRFVETGLNPGYSYRYSIAAFNGGQYSPKSAEAEVTTTGVANGTQPPPPSPDVDTPEFISPPPPANSAGSGSDSSETVPDGYALVFSDEFNNGSIDASKWNTRYRWGANWIINNEEQYYVDVLGNPGFGQSPFWFNDGTLNISATRTPDWLRSSANNQRYLSGAMTTHNKFKMTYGYVEMRARLPRGKGLWPAFWLLHEHNDGNRPEIDVMELLGDDPGMVYQTYHYYDNWSLRSTPSFQAPGPDYSANYHVFGMQWEPGRIIWYVDGRETNRYESGNVSNEEMYILLNLALGGSWAGSPDASTPFPATFSIDYIRAYKRR